MAFSFLRRSRNMDLINRLHGEIMAAARQPAFFIYYGVADTVAGRFEMLSLHAGLLIWRIETLPAPGPDLAQDLTDAVFRNIDIALREIGVGDVAMPKKMKVMAQGYLGRTVAYRMGLHAPETEGLARALARNVYGDEICFETPDCRRLARYTRRLHEVYDPLTLVTIMARPLPAVAATDIS